MTKLGLRLHATFAALLISTFSLLTFAQEGDPAPTSAPEAASAEGAESSEGAEAAADSTPPEESEPAGEGAEATAEDAKAPTSEVDGETYRVRLRDLEQRVDELKEQIRRSHTRLSLLSDTILAGASGGARAEIEFVNDLSGAWRLVEAVFVLDGAVQYKKTDDTGVLAKQRRIPIFSGSVPTGDHNLQVLLKLRGHGFGVFSYLRGIEASVKSDHSFTLSDGKVLELKVTAWEQGGPTTPVEEQPDIRFSSKTRAAGDTPSPVAAPGARGSGSVSSQSSKKGQSGKASLGGAAGSK